MWDAGDFEQELARAVQEISPLEGSLADDEIRFLFAAAALPSAEGAILEIGSFKGKSTVTLARGAEFAGSGKVVACDPFSQPSRTDPAPGENVYEDFVATLKRMGVEGKVDVHRKRSRDLAREWEGSVRFLWIDGDHTYEGVKQDVKGFFRYLSEGAIVAFHDVFHEFDGPIRCFIEDILLSDGFGMCGFHGSIGWGQYVSSGGMDGFRDLKAKLFGPCQAFLSHVCLGTPWGGPQRWRASWRRRHSKFVPWLMSRFGCVDG